MRVTLEVGQVWDDVFGKYTYEVIFLTGTNALMRNRTNTDHEVLVRRDHLAESGHGWRLLS